MHELSGLAWCAESEEAVVLVHLLPMWQGVDDAAVSDELVTAQGQAMGASAGSGGPSDCTAQKSCR